MQYVRNPTIHQAYLRDLVTIWEAARATGVKATTLRVWESRGKICRMPLPGGEALYHLPTVIAAAAVTQRKFTPADPAANARGSHKKAA